MAGKHVDIDKQAQLSYILLLDSQLFDKEEIYNHNY
jgi:hypothetical protein